MTGYLQRLLGSVRQPAESVHPLLGSVFSPPPRGSEQETSPPHQEISALGQSEPLWPRPPHAEQASTSSSPPASFTPQIQPALSQVGSSTAAASPKSVRGEDSLAPLFSRALLDELASRIEREREPDAVVKVEKQEELSQRVDLPESQSLVKTSRLAEEAGLKPQPFARVIPSVKREPPLRAPAQPDEIQIHIGRIEVTAVQQTPARPALKTSRRGPVLDEYLKRRDRRG